MTQIVYLLTCGQCGKQKELTLDTIVTPDWPKLLEEQ